MSDSPVAKARWEATQKRLGSLEKQVKLLFKMTRSLQVENEWDGLPEVVKSEMQNYARHLIKARGLSPEQAAKAFDWILNFVDSHKELF